MTKKKLYRDISLTFVIMVLLSIPDMIPLKQEAHNAELEELKAIIDEQPDDSDPLFWLGLSYHDMGRKEKKSGNRAIGPLKESLKLRYTPEVESYLGSSYTLKGRDAFNPILKLIYVWKGLWHMDRAVRKSDGSNLLPWIIRMENNGDLPKYFFRSGIVEKDRLFLKEKEYE